MQKKFIFIIILVGYSFTSEMYAQIVFPEKKDYRIAVLGCLKQLEPAPALYQYSNMKADLALWIGDNIYSDTKNDPNLIAQNYQKLASLPSYQMLKDSVPFLATWDDHDYGLNNAGGNYPFKYESKEFFRRFWELENEIPKNQNGIYYSQFKNINDFKVQLIFLDTRFNRDPVQIDGKGDTLGEKQWLWLEKELQKTADLRIIISGYQILLTKESSSETWQRFPHAYNRLINIIHRTHAEGVVFLTGDQHYGEVSRKDGLLGYDGVELQFAGINQIEDPEYNPLRVASVIKSKHSVAFLDLKLKKDKDNEPYLEFYVYDAMNGQKELDYRLRLNELKYQFNIEGEMTFIDETEILINHNYKDLVLKYTFEQRNITNEDVDWTEPIVVKNTSEVRYALFDNDGNQRSEMRKIQLEKVTPINSISLDENKTQRGLSYRYAEGNWKVLPNMDAEKILKEGISSFPKLTNIALQEDHFAIQWNAWIFMPEDAMYEFSITSDDGSNLYIHERLVIDNNGSHSKRMRTATIALKKGWHPFRLDYFEDYSGEFLEIKYRKLGDQTWHQPSENQFKTIRNN